MCCNESHTGLGPVSLALAGLVLAARALWWLASRIAGPLALVALVLAYRWSTGAPIRPSRRGGPRRLTRPLRATLQNLASLVVLGLVAAPVVTVASVVVAAAGIGTAALVVRVRARRRSAPRRVRVTIGRPVTTPRSTTPNPAMVRAIAAAPATGPGWTEHQLRRLPQPSPARS
jgi:hypothetical protein